MPGVVRRWAGPVSVGRSGEGAQFALVGNGAAGEASLGEPRGAAGLFWTVLSGVWSE